MARREEQAFQQELQRIETLVHNIEMTADPATRASAEELVQVLLELHGAGIERMLELLWEAGEGGQAIVTGAFAQDDLVGSLLLLHGLHPVDLDTRVRQALDKVRPYLGSHGGNVELLGIADGVVRLRLQGSCEGCPSSRATLKYAIEDGIYAVAPDVNAIEVEGVVDQPFTPPAGFIPLMEVGSSGQGHTSGGEWVAVDGLGSLADGAVRVVDVGGLPVLFCHVDENFYAYENTCPSCGQLVGQGRLQGVELVCAGCGHRYDVMRAGRDLDQPHRHLEPLPLLEEQGAASRRINVALPVVQR